MEPSDHGPYAHARGTFAILYALGLFAAIRFLESLPHFGAVWLFGRSHGITSLVVAWAAISIVGLAARAAILLRAVRLPAGEALGGPLPAWKPIGATVAFLLAWVAASAVPAAQSVLLGRMVEVESFARLTMVTSGGAFIEGFFDQVILVVCLWLAFTRGRDVTLAPRA